MATLHNNARTDRELLTVWLKSHADGSPHTIRVYSRVGERFLGALAAAGCNLRQATVEDVQASLEAMRTKEDGSAVRPASVNTYVAAVKVVPGLCPLRGLHPLQRRTAHQAQEGAAPNCTPDLERGRGCRAHSGRQDRPRSADV